MKGGIDRDNNPAAVIASKNPVDWVTSSLGRLNGSEGGASSPSTATDENGRNRDVRGRWTT